MLYYCCNVVDPFESFESAPPMDYDSSDVDDCSSQAATDH